MATPKTVYQLVAVHSQGKLMISFEEFQQCYQGNLQAFLAWVVEYSYQLEILSELGKDEAHP